MWTGSNVDAGEWNNNSLLSRVLAVATSEEARHTKLEFKCSGVYHTETVTLKGALRYPSSRLAQRVLQLIDTDAGWAPLKSPRTLHEWWPRTAEVPTGTYSARIVKIIANVHEYGTLCGAPLEDGDTLEWLRRDVLVPYGLPDILDLPYTQAGRLPQDKAAKDKLLALYREAAVQEAVAAVAAMLPSSGMVLTRAHAAFVLTTEADGETLGPVRLQVARVVGGLKGAAIYTAHKQQQQQQQSKEAQQLPAQWKATDYSPIDACGSVFQVWESGCARMARGTELRLQGGAELLPQVVEAVVQGVRELPCGLAVQLLWVPLVERQQQQQKGAAAGGQQGADGQHASARAKENGADGVGPRGVDEAVEAAAVCKVPVLQVRL